jgi:hypothetical protein
MRYFNGKTKEFTFDLKTADVRCSLFGKDYRHNSKKDKNFEDIAKYEIKLEDIEECVEVSDMPPEYAEPLNRWEYAAEWQEFYDLEFYGSHKELHTHPNGYDGSKPVGTPLSTIRGTRVDRDDDGEIVCVYDVVTLQGANHKASWGDEKLPNGELKFPDMATLAVRYVVYWLNQRPAPPRIKSPLICAIMLNGEMRSHNGTFNLKHNPDGFIRFATPAEGFEGVNETWGEVPGVKPC